MSAIRIHQLVHNSNILVQLQPIKQQRESWVISRHDQYDTRIKQINDKVIKLLNIHTNDQIVDSYAALSSGSCLGKAITP